MNIQELLQVYNFNKKCNLDNNINGINIIAELEGIHDCYISCGISNEESFSQDFINKYNINEQNIYIFDRTNDLYSYSNTKKKY